MGHFEPYIEYRTSISTITLRNRNGEEVFVQIAPGTSFGGNHATTRLCLKAAEEVLNSRSIKDVLDLGCGSGILAISAAALGARNVLAVDIDPVAVEETARNTETNGVSDRVKVLHGSLQDISQRFQLILANIVTDELMKMAQPIKSLVVSDGILVVSGVSELKKERAISAFEEAGFSLNRDFKESGWVALWFDSKDEVAP